MARSVPVLEPQRPATSLATTKLLETGPLLHCSKCRVPLADEYYQVNGEATVCKRCKNACVASRLGSPRVAFLRAWLFGTAAGLLGTALLVALVTFTGSNMRFLAALVGFLVGKGVHVGSRGRSGWVYQTMAAIISYYCIIGAYVPDLMEIAYTAWGVHQPTLATQLLALVTAWSLAWVFPFMALAENIGYLTFTTIAMFAAWKLNALPGGTVHVMGPFRVAPPGGKSSATRHC
jgi:hypothetical protein